MLRNRVSLGLAGVRAWEWVGMIKIRRKQGRMSRDSKDRHLNAATSGRNRSQEQDGQGDPGRWSFRASSAL